MRKNKLPSGGYPEAATWTHPPLEIATSQTIKTPDWLASFSSKNTCGREETSEW